MPAKNATMTVTAKTDSGYWEEFGARRTNTDTVNIPVTCKPTLDTLAEILRENDWIVGDGDSFTVKIVED